MEGTNVSHTCTLTFADRRLTGYIRLNSPLFPDLDFLSLLLVVSLYSSFWSIQSDPPAYPRNNETRNRSTSEASLCLPPRRIMIRRRTYINHPPMGTARPEMTSPQGLQSQEGTGELDSWTASSGIRTPMSRNPGKQQTQDNMTTSLLQKQPPIPVSQPS